MTRDFTAPWDPYEKRGYQPADKTISEPEVGPPGEAGISQQQATAEDE